MNIRAQEKLKFKNFISFQILYWNGQEAKKIQITIKFLH